MISVRAPHKSEPGHMTDC